MARYIGPKRKLSRREGTPLFQKDVKYMGRRAAALVSGRPVRAKRVSEYGLQLREKQKAKRFFGLLERQFRGYFEKASKIPGATGISLLELLEMRLDNIVYRLGFAQSRAGARQLVSHGHILVDGQKVTIPSYQIEISQTIAISPKIMDNIQVKKALTDSTLPQWLERKAVVGKVLRKPDREEMEQGINEQLIVEFYSR